MRCGLPMDERLPGDAGGKVAVRRLVPSDAPDLANAIAVIGDARAGGASGVSVRGERTGDTYVEYEFDPGSQ